MTHSKKKKNSSLIDVRLNDIQAIHPAIQNAVATTANLIYASAPDDYSEPALHCLLVIHPIHVVKLEGKLYVIAGFRSYELACLRLSEGAQITCILHTSLASEELSDIAIIDIAGSPIMHSLGPKYVQQLQTLALSFSHRASLLFPKLKSIRRIRGQKKTSD
ncbi:hypothetical protein SAMN06297280_3450 [Arsukibacterium tuosuense]|uniref:Uncharacterized protein n=1 Tax=Arsukibacterium tuosuense TaxID=1323745 RepID=A0A285JHM7_9GAMM|nr:hypothetical protein [Arsukibacterium tuosuense]SNY58631.1 hypothetical protein SAMN06297280_3450 [Arsukibacterium tuosuense]